MSSVSQTVIKHKVGLLNLAVELGNVSKACQMMGMSRDTFYRYRNAHDSGGVQALLEANRLMAKSALAMSYANWVSSFRLVACARCGYGTI